tara:strand:- start:675 stop:815 length:141 start_codon:yes stop_codon:yes gene_type:complete
VVYQLKIMVESEWEIVMVTGKIVSLEDATPEQVSQSITIRKIEVVS